MSGQLPYMLIAALGALILAISFVFDTDDDGDHTHVISTKAIAVFLGGFGVVGGITSSIGFSTPISTLVGCAGGGSAAGMALVLIKALRHAQSSTQVSEDDVVGRHGVVHVDIPNDGLGQVTISLPGRGTTTMAARSGVRIRAGTTIVVRSNSGGVLTVDLKGR